VKSKDSWLSRKLWFTVALIVLSTWALVNHYILGREWIIFVGALAGAYLYLQGSIDIHRVKLSAGAGGITLDNTDNGGVK
jgi:uncharacterized membrane protein SirB2